MSPLVPHNRSVTIGEPIDSLTADRGDQFNLGLTIFDDQGVAWPDSYDVDLFMYMNINDIYSGTGTDIAHFSGTTVSGASTVFVTASGTANPGDYKVEIILSSGSGATDPIVSAGIFDFVITGD